MIPRRDDEALGSNRSERSVVRDYLFNEFHASSMAVTN